TALEDVGPAGVDKGKGGKYLILPPSYRGQVPDGYIALPSQTYQSYAILRSILRSGSDADVAKAVAYGKRVKLYPLSQAANPPPTRLVDMAHVVFDATIPYDARFFQSLDRVIQSEPWLERDRVMIDMLRSVGIEKGKPFAPGETKQGILTSAAKEAHAELDAGLVSLFQAVYFPTSRWALPAFPDLIKGLGTNFADPNAYPVDARGSTYMMTFFSAKHLGAGQFYLMTIKDKDGMPFDGGATYRLTVPAKAPVAQYWSATVYDRATHALVRDVARASRSSQNTDIQKN